MQDTCQQVGCLVGAGLGGLEQNGCLIAVASGDGLFSARQAVGRELQSRRCMVGIARDGRDGSRRVLGGQAVDHVPGLGQSGELLCDERVDLGDELARPGTHVVRQVERLRLLVKRPARRAAARADIGQPRLGNGVVRRTVVDELEEPECLTPRGARRRDGDRKRRHRPLTEHGDRHAQLLLAGTDSVVSVH